MSIDSKALKEFSVQLFKINAVKFGEFKTKIGLMTPVYCDLRVIISYPDVMKQLTNLLIQQIKSLKNFDIICGVPYTALPIATAVSLETNIPMVMRRKEAKDYGTKKLIEGVFQPGNNCLILEDVVTSGSSILETVRDLENEGIKCKDVVVLLNRQQGGSNILAKNGVTMHALLSLTQLIEYLEEEGCIDNSVTEKVRTYIKENQVTDLKVEKKPDINRLHLSFESRIKHAKNPIAAKLFQIMSSKKTTLCLAADVTDSTDLLNLAEKVGPYICALKTHIDILDDFHINLIKPLKEIAKRYNFLLFEDRKFSDIGKTVESQYSCGVYKISSWANLVTAHSVIGRGVLDALKDAPGLPDRGVFLLAETSASENLITSNYTQSTLKLALQYENLITGIVCQNPLFLDKPGMIQLTPGVNIDSKNDNLGQQYNTPEKVVVEGGADVAVVGRGIVKAQDPVGAAELYRKVLWEAYEKRVVS